MGLLQYHSIWDKGEKPKETGIESGDVVGHWRGWIYRIELDCEPQ